MSTIESSLDIKKNRSDLKYKRSELIARVLWSLAWPFFRYSPRIFFGWRASLLRLFGASIGKRVHIYPTATVYFPWMLEIGDDSAIGEDAYIYNLGKITIGHSTTISHRVHLCAGTHDHTDPCFPLVRPPIVIGNSVWICADVFIGPGVQVGEGAVVGARSAAFRDIGPWSISGGNPAKPIGKRVVKQSSSPPR